MNHRLALELPRKETQKHVLLLHVYVRHAALPCTEVFAQQPQAL